MWGKIFLGVKMDLSRVAMVIGKNKLPVLGQARIAVVGLGGVGSYVAESLCRSGVGHLLLIDADKVAASNINRQLPALTSTFGRFKTEVVRQRLLDINPDCEIETVSKFYEPGAFAEFFSGSFTFIADAIEDISGTSVCPLARSVRKQLRAAGVKKGVTVVYSKEPVQRAEAGEVPGSMVFVPASAGLLMASYIVRQIIAENS